MSRAVRTKMFLFLVLAASHGIKVIRLQSFPLYTILDDDKQAMRSSCELLRQIDIELISTIFMILESVWQCCMQALEKPWIII